MRWVLFAIVLYFVVVVQTAVAPFLAVQGIRPDLPALLAIHVASAAPVPDALLATWVIGLVVDLNEVSFGAHSNVGAAALAYGLVAALIVWLRRWTFREHASTYFVFAFVGTTLIHALRALHMLYVTGQMDRVTEGIWVALCTGIYAALISPYAHWVLRRARNVLGIGPVRTLRVR